MHYAKYGKQAVGSILLHSDRGIDKPDMHEHSNENIDRSRTHLNYDLKDRVGQTAYEYYKQRIEQIAMETKERTGKNIRKDAVTLCSWVLTMPKDLAEDKATEFFKTAYKWFAERYKEDNIVTAAVHMDENTPHMHLQFTPIIEKGGIRRLCAKDIETRKTLATAHQKLQEHLKQELGCEVNLLNGATEGGNKTIQQLKVEELEVKIAELSEQYEKMTSTLSNKDLKEIDVTPKRLTGGFKGLTPQQAQKLVNTSLALSKENKQLKNDNKQLKNDKERLIKEKNRIVREKNSVVLELYDIKQEKQTMFSRKQLEEQQEKTELTNRAEQAEKEINKLKNYMNQIRYSDGTSILENYENEQKCSRQKSKGWER